GLPIGGRPGRPDRDRRGRDCTPAAGRRWPLPRDLEPPRRLPAGAVLGRGDARARPACAGALPAPRLLPPDAAFPEGNAPHRGRPPPPAGEREVPDAAG